MARSASPHDRSRRRVLAGGLGAAAALSAPLLPAAEALPRLALYGPPAGPSITLARAVASGALKPLANEVTLTVWRTPDELRAGLTSGAIDLSVVPVQAAANLYNRGMGLRLVNVMTNGLLHVVGPKGGPADLDGLVGKRVAVPFVNDTPDLILKALLERRKLAGRVELLSSGSPIEAAQLLLAGRVDAALLAEPAATAAVMRSAGGPRPLERLIDLQQDWGRALGRGPVIPQAGLAVARPFFDRHRETLAPLQAALAATVAEVNAEPTAAAASASGPLELPAPLIAASVPHAKLTATPASAARPDIEPMLELMAATDAAIIGGRLPDDGFYAL